MPPRLIEMVAERFKALSEPARLALLNSLRSGEMAVSELMEATGLSQANTSKHLQLLYKTGYVDRRKDGLNVYYRIADESIYDLCDIMCGRLEAELDATREAIRTR